MDSLQPMKKGFSIASEALATALATQLAVAALGALALVLIF